jgi:hypothetical protein
MITLFIMESSDEGTVQKRSFDKIIHRFIDTDPSYGGAFAQPEQGTRTVSLRRRVLKLGIRSGIRHNREEGEELLVAERRRSRQVRQGRLVENLNPIIFPMELSQISSSLSTWPMLKPSRAHTSSVSLGKVNG